MSPDLQAHLPINDKIALFKKFPSVITLQERTQFVKGYLTGQNPDPKQAAEIIDICHKLNDLGLIQEILITPALRNVLEISYCIKLYLAISYSWFHKDKTNFIHFALGSSASFADKDNIIITSYSYILDDQSLCLLAAKHYLETKPEKSADWLSKDFHFNRSCTHDELPLYFHERVWKYFTDTQKKQLLDHNIKKLLTTPGTVGCLTPQMACSYLPKDTHFLVISFENAVLVLDWLLKYYPAYVLDKNQKEQDFAKYFTPQLKTRFLILKMFEQNKYTPAEMKALSEVPIADIEHYATLTPPASNYTRAQVLKIVKMIRMIKGEGTLADTADVKIFLEIYPQLEEKIAQEFVQKNKAIFQSSLLQQDIFNSVELNQLKAILLSEDLKDQIEIKLAVTLYADPVVKGLMKKAGIVKFLYRCCLEEGIDHSQLFKETTEAKLECKSDENFY